MNDQKYHEGAELMNTVFVVGFITLKKGGENYFKFISYFH